MSNILKKIPFKNWFLAHPSLTGSLVGIFSAFLLGFLSFPGPLFLAAPFLAGIIAGHLGGSGTKAGLLTLVLPITVMIMIPIVFPNVDWTASTIPEVKGIGVINGTMAALTNGLIRSSWGIANGLASISTAIGGIITLIILIMLPILIAIGLTLTAVLGFIGGKIGGVTKKIISPSKTASSPNKDKAALKLTGEIKPNFCVSCGQITNSEGTFCPNCGALTKSVTQKVNS